MESTPVNIDHENIQKSLMDIFSPETIDKIMTIIKENTHYSDAIILPKKYGPVLAGLIKEVNEKYPESPWKNMLEEIKNNV